MFNLVSVNEHVFSLVSVNRNRYDFLVMVHHRTLQKKCTEKEKAKKRKIKKLFTEYKKAIDTYDHIPILLFNEADAILGSRRLVIDRVEQMENTLQNILLQELENFRGIFIATTKLEENLDPAFDRRILYKVRFNTPTDEMRESIWKDKLPGLSEDLVRYVNSLHKLTGGQIDNVAKKVEVSLLLFSSLS